jgi:hypothetical protein
MRDISSITRTVIPTGAAVLGGVVEGPALAVDSLITMHQPHGVQSWLPLKLMN